MIYERYKLLCPGSRFKCVESNPIDPTGIIGTGLSFIGGLISNSTNKKIAREQMAQQERFFNTQMDYTQQAEQRAYDYADKAWERETAYNDPAAQRLRFENAGLNPALMMQGQNAVVGSMQDVTGGNSAPGAPSPVGYEYRDPITPAVNTYLQSRLLNSQSLKTEEEAHQIQIDSRYREIEKIGGLFKLKAEIEALRAQAAKDNKNVDYFDKQIDMINEELSFLQDTHQSRVNEQGHRTFLLDQEGRKLQIDNFWADLEHEQNLKIAKAQIKRINSEIKLALSQKDLNDKQAKKVAEETSGLILQNSVYKPGSKEYRLQRQYVKAQIYNLLKGKINILGVGGDVPQTQSSWVFGDD